MEKYAKRLDTLAMDRVLRDSDKGNLDLARSEMELGLFSREPVDDKVSSRARWSAVQAAQCDSADITLVWRS